MKLRLLCTFLLLISSATGVLAGGFTEPAEPTTEVVTEAETAVVDVEAETRLFAAPAFGETLGTCLGEAPAPLEAVGLSGCPYGPTCYSDDQCAFACATGTGVCAPDFCCWCVA